MPKQRVFIAFPVPEKVRQALKKAQEFLVQQNPKAHVIWTDPALFHLTLAFIGEVTTEQLSTIEQTLAETARSYHSFSYWLDRADAFPNKAHPSVLVVRTKEESHVGRSLVRSLHEKLNRAKLLSEYRPWKPHITIGRNKGDAPIQGLQTVRIDQVVWPVTQIDLIESTLTKSGPVYTTLNTFDLQ